MEQVFVAIVVTGVFAWITATQVEKARARRTQRRSFVLYQRKVLEALLVVVRECQARRSLRREQAQAERPGIRDFFNGWSEWADTLIREVINPAADAWVRLDPNDERTQHALEDWLRSLDRLAESPGDQRANAIASFDRRTSDLAVAINERLRDLH